MRNQTGNEYPACNKYMKVNINEYNDKLYFF